MDIKEALKNIPDHGFIKLTSQRLSSLTAEQRIGLIRRGNELYNKGEVEQAKRIFLTTGYSDGIIRVGDLYYSENKFIEAFRMYVLAPAPAKKERMIESMAMVVQHWLKTEKEEIDA
ncbi:MAG: hypothetical protein E4H36_00250 [Spirochaetales bacterium]|nr:MAG: hypothetical protein E4H36_00250 [Spirochaetales bacterium]